MAELVVKQTTWIWLSWSYQSTPVLSFALGRRDIATGKQMWDAIPKSFARKQVYTDGFKVYEEMVPWWRHWVCPKGSGDTNMAEDCNVYLRHRLCCMNRVSYRVRKSASFARSIDWLWRRLFFVLFRRNERIAQRLKGAPKLNNA